MMHLESQNTSPDNSEAHQSTDMKEFFLDKLIEREGSTPTTPSPGISTLLSSSASLKNTLYMGFAICIWLTGLISSPIFVSEADYRLGFDSLGYSTLLVFNGVLTVSMLTTPPIVKKWTYKNGVFIGSLGSLLMVLAGAMTTLCSSDPNPSYFWCSDGWMYSTNIIFSAIFGLTSSMFWLSANRYINGCTDSFSKGQYFGIFAGFIFISRIARSALVAFNHQNFGNISFYALPAGCVIVAICLFFIAPRVPRYYEEESTGTLKKEAQKMLHIIWKGRMRYLLVFFFVIGMLEAFTEVEIRIISHSDHSDWGTDDTSYLTIYLIQGVLGALASCLAGKQADKVTTKTAISTFNGIVLLAMVVSLVSYETHNLVSCYLMGVFMGIGYGGTLCLVYLVMAKDFKGTIISFAAAQAVYSFGTLVGIALSLIPTHLPLICIILVLLIANQISITFYQSHDSITINKLQA